MTQHDKSLFMSAIFFEVDLTLLKIEIFVIKWLNLKTALSLLKQKKSRFLTLIKKLLQHILDLTPPIHYVLN